MTTIAKILNKYKKINVGIHKNINGYQLEFRKGMQAWFNSQESVSAFHHINE